MTKKRICVFLTVEEIEYLNRLAARRKKTAAAVHRSILDMYFKRAFKGVRERKEKVS